jgi:hypothetical protein
MADNIALNEDQRKSHENLLLHLLATREKLMMVDPNSLTLDQHIKWNDQLYQVGLAITAVQGAVLTSISEDYAKALPNIEKATDALTDKLYTLKKANDVIAAVGSAIGTISSLVTLLK